MPKQIKPDELEAVEKWIAAFPSGANLAELVSVAAGAVSKRTLQRRISELLAASRILSFRDSRQVRFRRAGNVAIISAALPAVAAQISGEVY